MNRAAEVVVLFLQNKINILQWTLPTGRDKDLLTPAGYTAEGLLMPKLCG